MTEPFLADRDFTLYLGDVLDVLPTLEAGSVHCCVCSPPYWGLRSYLPDGHDDKPLELGLEPTPDAYVARMVEVFREVKRVLRDDGTCWLNLGDSYNNRSVSRKSSHQGGLGFESEDLSKSWAELTNEGRTRLSLTDNGMKEKDLCGIPWRVAFALQADGWYLRSDIIWSKPNPMPESVTDRPTKAHEYVFLLSKSPRYFFDQEAVREPHTQLAFVAQVERQRAREANGGLDQKPSHMDSPATGVQRFGSTTADRYLNPSGRNVRSVWEIATQPFSARVLGGGDGRITSPDCPVHGDRRHRATTDEHDGHEGTSPSGTPRSDDRPALEPLADSVPTDPRPEQGSAPDSSDSPLPSSSPAATPRNTGSRRTDPAPATTQPCTASAQTDDHTDDTPTSPVSGVLFDHTPENRTAPADSDAHPSDGTPGHTARTLLTGGAYSPPGQSPHGNARGKAACTCEYIDHFATYPEELVRRCILAGCPEDGTVLDPFMGSGTTALVARKHGRRSVGIELNPAYAELCARRLQQQSLFTEATP